MSEGTQSNSWLDVATWNGRVYSGGWRPAKEVFDVREPATGALLGRLGLARPADVANAAEGAHKNQTSWAATGYERRAAVIRGAALKLEADRGSVIDWLMRESGSIRAKAQFEVDVTIKALRQAAAMPFEAQGQLLPSESGHFSIARRVPIGVVGVISPFNFPLYLAMRAVAPALAVGNAVVLKPDQRTAVSGGVIVARLFETAGLPEGVLHVLAGGADAGEALCTDPHIGLIQFTGSSRAGQHVGRLAGENLKKVSLELGGKNSLIILDDADLDLAVANATWSAYLHQGQICMAAGRILVQEAIVYEFSRRLAKKALGLPVGDPLSDRVALGPLISNTQVDSALRAVHDAVNEGAHLMAGGTANGLFFAPTVLGAVKPHMAAYREELFAPIAVIVPFGSDEEAVRMTNDSGFGLSAGIISSSIGRALLIGNQLKVGLVHINDQTVNDSVVNPFGGVGKSGNGTSIGGPANWELFTHWQWLTMKSVAPTYPL